MYWSDFILVMENGQGARIVRAFRHMDLPPIHVLHIEDEYEYLDQDLIDMLTDRINSTLKVEWQL